MQFNFTEKWFEKAIKLEGNSNVSAGKPRSGGLQIFGEDLRIFVDKLYGYSNPRSVRLIEFPVILVDKNGNVISEPSLYTDDVDNTVLTTTSKKMPEKIYKIIDIIRYIVDTSAEGIPTRVYLRAIFDDPRTGKRHARYAVHIPKEEK
jgi:hypothetical protein